MTIHRKDNSSKRHSPKNVKLEAIAILRKFFRIFSELVSEFTEHFLFRIFGTDIVTWDIFYLVFKMTNFSFLGRDIPVQSIIFVCLIVFSVNCRKNSDFEVPDLRKYTPFSC